MRHRTHVPQFQHFPQIVAWRYSWTLQKLLPVSDMTHEIACFVSSTLTNCMILNSAITNIPRINTSLDSIFTLGGYRASSRLDPTPPGCSELCSSCSDRLSTHPCYYHRLCSTLLSGLAHRTTFLRFPLQPSTVCQQYSSQRCRSVML